MSESADSGHRPRLSAVWVIPLLAALIGAWLVYSHVTSQGPVITLKLADAEGISAGKTAVRTRNVQVGVVKQVSLSEDLSHTLLTVQMQAGTGRMLQTDTQFWVVKPRVGREGISGLNTVLSGAYIQLVPGESGVSAASYTVNDSSPPEETGDGLFLQLVSEAGSAVDTGDPVNFRSLRVGRVVATEFDPGKKVFRHRLFIEKPYDVLVTRGSRFWEVSGVSFKLGAQGFEAKLGSLETVLGGGVAFAVPDPNISVGEPVQDGDEFVLYKDQEAARRAIYSLTLDYVLLIDGSVRGLRAGAPVEYRGVRVGTVERVAWGFGFEGPKSMRQDPVPVLIRLEPERIAQKTEVAMVQWEQEVTEMINGGLRASLQPANLLTGALFVDLAFHGNDDGAVSAVSYRSVPVFPSVDHDGIQKIEEQVSQLLRTWNQLPFEAMADRLNNSLDRMASASERLERILSNPAIVQLPQEAVNTMNALQEALQGWRADGEGDAYQQVQTALGKLNRLLDDAAPVIDTLNERPNALIFQGRPTPDPQPRATR
ncbi:intermembrane transport protein PqiB [Marinobacter sp. SS21]|uniref:intermembrane transport protein PqiB n=1 Tax=Marinobacter sp. SS21 TaxID=2979460 RepID=UPI00232DEBAE|nr:intermembrane transport protein PqiB [Marinobacter sp. SS21]MDC0661454.1 intermembrane transport protein PqiB [Marinobacter sp. SS21]